MTIYKLSNISLSELRKYLKLKGAKKYVQKEVIKFGRIKVYQDQ